MTENNRFAFHGNMHQTQDDFGPSHGCHRKVRENLH